MSAITTHSVPELLAPAGSLEKLKVATLYGADAVYLGGEKFGLRSAADNFTQDEIEEGVNFAHKNNTKVYVVLNSFLHDAELKELPSFLDFLNNLKVDGLIASDLGVISTVSQHSTIPIHLSTQASCLNVESAKLWKQMGVKRIILGREVSIDNAKKIKEATGLETEIFIHGSLCMAYSGNCTISNYTFGRDSNRGGCAQSCRFEYRLNFDDQIKDLFFMSSKDLEGLQVLPEIIHAGIDSIKIEGRMKTHHYVGTVCKIYAEALKHLKGHGKLDFKSLCSWQKELRKVTHRDYTLGNLISPAQEDSTFSKREHSDEAYKIVGIVLETVPGKHLLIEVRNAFYKNDKLELLTFKDSVINFVTTNITNILNEEITKTKPGTVIKLPYLDKASQWNIIRKKVDN